MLLKIYAQNTISEKNNAVKFVIAYNAIANNQSEVGRQKLILLIHVLIV